MNRASWFAAVAIVACGSRLVSQVPGELRGRVSESTTGRPIANADVEIVGRSERARSASDGAFIVRGLDPDRYHVRVRALGHAADERDIDIVNGRVTAIVVELRPVAANLDVVRISAAADAALAPGASTFDRAAIEQSNKRDVGELLQTVGSVVITQSGGPGSPSRVSIRGSSSDEVLVLVDGVPVNSAIDGNADLSRINLETVERVTVVPGAQSAKYGSRALAGVVLVETRRAVREASAALRAGSWGERAASATVGDVRNMDVGQLNASLTAQARDVAGDFAYDIPAVRGGGRTERTNADVESRSAVAATSFETARTVSRAHLDWDRTDRGIAGSIVQPSVTGRSNEHRLAGGLETRGGWSDLSARASVDVANEHSHFADPTPPFGGRYDDTIDAHTMRGSLAGGWTTAGSGVELGAEARTTSVAATSLAGAPKTQTDDGLWLTARRSGTVGSTTVSGDIAARADWDSFVAGATFSPRATLTATHHAFSLAVSSGNGFSPPSLGDQFFHEGVLVRPNPSLTPERVRGDIEVRAAMHRVDAGPVALDAEASAFRADIDGMILWMPDFRFVWSPTNFDVHRRGWDATTRISAPSLGASVAGTVSQTDVTYTGAVLSGQVAYRPRTTGNVAAELQRGRARVSVTTRYVGARRTVPGSPLNMLEPYWISDVQLAVPVTRGRWTADGTVGATNIFDRPAAMLVDYPFGGRAWTIGVRLYRTSSDISIQ